MKIYNPTGFSTNLTGSFSGSVKGTLTATGNIIPDVSGAYDIGSTQFPFKDLYITQNSLKFIDDSTGNEIGRISVNSNTGDIKLLNTKNLTAEEKANLTAENVGAEALSPVSASALWVSQSIFAGHENTNIGHTDGPFHTLHTQYVSASSTNITGDLKVGGTVTAQQFHTEFVSASIIYESGSTQFGNSSDDTHIFSGSISVSNGITGTLSTAAQPNITSVGTLSSLNVSGNLTVDTNTLFVDAANNRVGIGTTGPGSSLHLEINNPTTGVLAQFRNSASTSQTGAIISFTQDSLADWGIGQPPGANAFAFFSGTYPGNLGTERMRITSTGNVGIGTSSPSYRFEVRDTADAVIALVKTASNSLRFLSTSSGGVINQVDNNNLAFKTNDTERMRIDASGNVGIGTTPSGFLTSGYVLRLNGGGQTFLAFNNSTSTTQATGGLVIGNDSTGADIYQRENQPLRFYTNNSERMRIDGSGNVGIGTTSPIDKLHVSLGNTPGEYVTYGGTNRNANGLNKIAVFRHTYWNGGHREVASIGVLTSSSASGSGTGIGNLVFYTGTSGNGDNGSTSTERMRIDAGGNVLIGTASNLVGYGQGSGIALKSNGQISFAASGANESAYIQRDAAGRYFAFHYGNLNSTPSVIGAITTTGSSVSYLTTSDYRLKENVVDMTGALNRVYALKPCRFNFILDPETTVDGFLAHEVSEVIPEAISGEKDAVDTDGNPVYQGIDQSKLTPLLAAAIKELKDIVDQQQIEIDNLKAQLNG